MASDEAARRYAQAVFDIARDDGTIDQWRQELDDVASVLAESELAHHLADDRIPEADRYALVDRVLDVSPKALNLARLLISKGRSRGARFVAAAFTRMADEYQDRVEAEITSAIELSSQQVADIEQRLSRALNKQVHVRVTVDPSIVGGLIIQVGDQLTDGSIRTRLRRLERQLQGAA
ncbi:MAG: ATP synthase F1 subunit delta [Dehalococcoidia bacterium]|nr:ATP synthase F1 subunit delta [Dehalococcoidia bacterium]